MECKLETKVQDINSNNDHFTHKSPKLLLLEWCRKQNRRKPIYKTITTYAGKPKQKVKTNFTLDINCDLQVVLPDTKDANNDIVVFLDDEFTEQIDEDEVQQRAATAALFKAAGNSIFY